MENLITPYREVLFWFCLGAVAESILLLKNYLNFKEMRKLSSLLLFGLFVGILPFKNETNYIFEVHILVGIACYAVFFSIIYIKNVLPVIDEKKILLSTILFWYMYLFYFIFKIDYFESALILTALLLVPTSSAFIIAFNNLILGFKGKIFFYGWYLIMIVAFVLFQFQFNFLPLPANDITPESSSVLGNLISGMTVFYLIIHSFYLLRFIPWKAKNQSWQEAISVWKEFTGILSEKYSDTQLRKKEAALIVGVVIFALGVNNIFKFTPDNILVSFIILLTPNTEPILGFIKNLKIKSKTNY